MLLQSPDLLGDRAPYRKVAGMQARDVMAGGMCRDILGFDLVE